MAGDVDEFALADVKVDVFERVRVRTRVGLGDLLKLDHERMLTLPPQWNMSGGRVQAVSGQASSSFSIRTCWTCSSASIGLADTTRSPSPSFMMVTPCEERP